MLVGITAKVRNGLMLKYRMKEGGISQREAAERAGISGTMWCSMEGLSFCRVSWLALTRVADLVGCKQVDLCPKDLKGVDARLTQTIFRHVEGDRLLAYDHTKRLSLPDPSEEVELDDVRDVRKARITAVLQTLTYREREILKLRYGLGEDGHEYTLTEVGKILKVNRERVRQIEAKAISKLQKPVRARLLESVA